MVVSRFSDLLKTISPDSTAIAWNTYVNETKRLRTLAQQITTITPQKMIKDPNIQSYPNKQFATVYRGQNSVIGKMVLFNYDPKLKDKLPYYDMYPLIFPIEFYKDGYLGINMHYLPPRYRAQLMDALWTTLIEKDRVDEKSQLLISYQILKGASKFRYFKPTIHRYLYRHVTSKWMMIDPKQWDVALMLPVQQFKKASINTVWSASVQKIRK